MLLDSKAYPWFLRYQQDYVDGLYIHIPFCKKKCFYCDFATWVTAPGSDILDLYTESLIAHMLAYEELGILNNKLETAYIGGGTPTLLGTKNLARLISFISEHFSPKELSFEANPESSSKELLREAYLAGATRVSFGVQTTSQKQLELLGRIHTNEQVREALPFAKDLGFSVSADIMCATEALLEEEFCQSILDVLDLGIDHISVYPLQIEPNTALYKQTLSRFKTDEPAYNDPDIQAKHMLLAEEILTSFAFSRYEVASYAKGNHSCLHNQVYWTGRPYLGIGTSAASMLGKNAYAAFSSMLGQKVSNTGEALRYRFTEMRGRKAFAESGAASATYDSEDLSIQTALTEDLIMAARMSKALNPELIRAAEYIFGYAFLTRYVKLKNEGYITEDGSPTRKGWLMGDVISRCWIDLEDVSLT